MIGQKLNQRYEIIEHLGDGSTAAVYRAKDLVLGRDVALKILLPHVKESTRKRFLGEATAAAKLNHPNIMALYDIGEDKDRIFLVVEYVQGDPLTHYIPSAPSVVVELGRQIGYALQYAHDNEIIHRDIKPANIKVTPEGQVKIMDLGLALSREGKRVTAQGMVIGTPAYLSPEQAQGLPLDSRTDIYSLGIVLYELATGQLPFNADDITALLLQQVKQPPPPPRLIVPDLPIALEHVILKTLEKDPARRFQSARALADALQAALPPRADSERPTLPRRPADMSKAAAEHITKTAMHNAPTIRIILADDHTVVRRSLASYLETRDEFVVLAEANDGDSAILQTLALLPDVLILDLNMPGRGGLEVLPQIRQQAPDVKVLVLTGREENAYIVRALRAGAHGYVLKSGDPEDLVNAIHKVMEGELVLGKGVTQRVLLDLLNPNANDDKKLSEQEGRVLLLVAAGLDNTAIAQRIGSSMAAVIELLAKCMDKLGAKDRHDAALIALRDGHILLDDLHDITN